MTPEPAGSTWRERRESMGKTLTQVSVELRIGQRYLAGIEEGNFGDFPERVFSTGFIRSYARYLSQDPGPVLAEYERSIGSRDDTEMAAQLRFGWVERERERGSRRATYIVAAGVVLLVGVILAGVTLRTERRPLPPPPLPAPTTCRRRSNRPRDRRRPRPLRNRALRWRPWARPAPSSAPSSCSSRRASRRG